VPPYLSHNGSFRQGANFAVGGATALNSSFFHVGDAPGASLFPLNTSLEVQLGWFDDLKPSLCKTDQGYHSTIDNIYTYTYITKYIKL
jgi:hypothetical protein